MIGLDGATPNIIYPLAKKGILSHLKKIISTGICGNLRSTDPPVTCPAWVSSITGLNPGKHGIYDFFLSIDLRKRKIEYANSKKRRRKAVWNILSDYGKKVIVLNVPVTYPPEKVNGVMVSGMLTPSLRSDFTYPPRIKKDLLNLGYQIDLGETMLEKIISYSRDKIQMLKKIECLIERRLRAAQFLMKEFDWDLFMVVFVAFDRIQHLYWRFIDPKHIAYNPRESNSIYPHIIRVFRKLDMAVGKLVMDSGKNTNVIIYSDHGFKPLNTFYFPNNSLRKRGILKLNKHILHSRILTQTIAQNMTKIFHLDKLLQKVPPSIKRHIRYAMSPSANFLDIFDAVPDETKAFYFGNGFIIINKDCVRGEEEYDRIRSQIIHLFNKKYPFIKVFSKKQIYRGPLLENIPEIIIESRTDIGLSPLLPRNYVEFLDYKVKNTIPSLMWNGQHAQQGIIICMGPKFHGRNIIRANILDIAPTILKTFNLPLPSHLDGKSLI